MFVKIGRTIAIVSIGGYVLALILEWWRPGFVTFFWNPQMLIPVAIVGTVMGSGETMYHTHRVRIIVFRIVCAIVAIGSTLVAIPAGATRWVVAGTAGIVTFFASR